MNQLKFYISKGKNLPLIQTIEYRILFIENNVKNGLEQLFQKGITCKNMNITLNCLRIYEAIDKIEQAENLVQSWMINPNINKVYIIKYNDSIKLI